MFLKSPPTLAAQWMMPSSGACAASSASTAAASRRSASLELTQTSSSSGKPGATRASALPTSPLPPVTRTRRTMLGWAAGLLLLLLGVVGGQGCGLQGGAFGSGCSCRLVRAQ